MSKEISVLDHRRHPFVQVDIEVLRMVPKIGASAFAVYCALVSFSRPTRRDVFPGIETISKMIGLSKNTITSAVKDLVTNGLVDVARGSSSRATNVYTLLPTPTQNLDSQPVVEAQNLGFPKIAPKEEKEVLSKKKITDPRVGAYFKKLSEAGIVELQPGMVAGRIKALPPEVNVSTLLSAFDEFLRRPDPWVKTEMGINTRGFLYQLPKILPKFLPMKAGAGQPKTRIILTEEGPKRVPC